MDQETIHTISLAEKSKDYACEMHHITNCRYGDLPYQVHLQMVVDVGERFIHLIPEHARDKVRAMLWSHDVMEDTRQTYHDVCDVLGEEVADNIYMVTNELGKTRKERAEKTYPKIQGHKWATFVKGCDRYANTLNSKNNKHRMFVVYREEYIDFKSALYTPYSDLTELWNALDELNWGE